MVIFLYKTDAVFTSSKINHDFLVSLNPWAKSNYPEGQECVWTVILF